MRTAKATMTSALAVLVLLSSSHPPFESRAVQSTQKTTDECKPIGDRICQLKVQIKTRDERGSGTDNAVYFDIGPMGWKLNTPKHNDFESGNTDEFDISPPKDLTLTKKDILWLRLQKKGLIGFNGTSDGFDGAWHPERLVLIADGVPWQAAEITESLNSHCWFWRKYVTDNPPNPLASAANFARSLRLQPNTELKPTDKFIGFATTPFKKIGISGWLKLPDTRECMNGKRIKPPVPVPYTVCATGNVQASATSTDGLATIDLDVNKIEFCTKDGRCDDYALIKNLDAVAHERYLRIEYEYKHHEVPQHCEEVRICGELRWDTDKEGWWEIHPRNCEDVTFLYPTPVKCRRPDSR